MTQIVIVGMRRNGTTLLWDLLNTLDGFSFFYEPLARPKKSIGGGSGNSNFDYGKQISEIQRAGRKQQAWHSSLRMTLRGEDALNFGAPSKPSAEFATQVPNHIKIYLGSLLNSQENVVVKFTRMHHHIDVLKEIAPKSKLLIAVRDPRSVVGSYLWGKNQKDRGIYATQKDFFNLRTDRNAWSMRHLSDVLIRKGHQTADLSDLERVLLLWKHKYRRMREDSVKFFSEQHKVCKHEDFFNLTKPSIDSTLDFLGLTVEKSQSEWASTAIEKPGHLPPYHLSSAWDDAFSKLDMMSLVDKFGYGSCDYVSTVGTE